MNKRVENELKSSPIQTNDEKFQISATTLHVLAMLFMLSDHMWATVIPGREWMTCIGRIAFPIFAFMIVEGFFHTSNVKKYMGRMFLFALISEVPFDYMCGSTAFYPYQQNVLWTFLIALIGLVIMEKVRNGNRLWVTIIVDFLVIVFSFALGFLAMVDYYGVGVLTVYTFYFFRRRKWWSLLGQILVLYYLNVEILSGQYYPIEILGYELQVVKQGLALLSLVPIWMYRGKQGYHRKWFQYLCYAFYPAHILILVLIREIIV